MFALSQSPWTPLSRSLEQATTIGTNERTAEGSGTVAGSNCTPLTRQWKA